MDQGSKALALELLPPEGTSLLGGLVVLRVTRNMGGAFGLLQGFPLLFVSLGAVVVVFLLRMAGRVRGGLAPAGIALVLGGALGNLADRLFRGPGLFKGAVVDFVDLRFWPVFNLADVAILAGVALLSWAAARGERGGGRD